MSLVWVSAIRTSAFRRVGSATRARFGAGADLLTDFDRHLREDARHARFDLEVIEFAQPKLILRAALCDFSLLRGQL